MLVVIEHQQHEALYNLIAQHSGALWIGLIQRDCLASEALRNLLAACFHDFHTFPWTETGSPTAWDMPWGWAPHPATPPRLQPQLRFIQGRAPHPPVARPDRAVAALPPARTGDGTERHGQGAGGPGLHYSTFGEESPFVAVNCGAMPHQLIQSELFGHVKGPSPGHSTTR